MSTSRCCLLAINTILSRLPKRLNAEWESTIGYDVLRFQAGDNHLPKAQLLKLAGDQVEHARAVMLRGMAAVAIAIAKLL